MGYRQGLLEIKMAEIPEVIKRLGQLEGRITRMEKVVAMLYKVSNEMNILLNECKAPSNSQKCKAFDKDGNTYDGLDASIIDCRSPYVDMEMKQLIYDRLCMYIIDFYNKGDNEDEFLLALGFSINLYYIVGLGSTYGKFDIDKILKYIDSFEVKEYGKLINEFLYSKIAKWILDNEEYCKKYVPDLYMAVKEKNFNRKAENYLNEMISKYSDFRFGWVYCCVEKGLDFYKNKGEDIGVLKCKDKLGDELFLHIMGIRGLDEAKFEMVNGKLKRIRQIMLSPFGIGIPKIKTINNGEIYNSVRAQIEGRDDIVSPANIREKIEHVLDINVCDLLMDDNPLKYTGKLFEVVDKQRKELESENREILRLNKQRSNLIDHLAHSWGNECYPEIVKKVANELLRHGENSLANKLFKAYNSENNLMGEIIFLQAAMEDRSEKLKEIFKDSFYISGKGTKEMKIQSIMEEALENLVFSLLNYSGNKKKRNICQKKICTKYSLEELAQDYSKRFEVDGESISESFVQWFSKNIFPITVQIDECWNKINFGKSEYGKIVVKNIFTELFTNVLYHGEEVCEVIFGSVDDRLYIKVRNRVSEKIEGQKKGLYSLKEVIARLNYNTSVSEEEGLSYGMENNNMFETVVVFAKELMLKEVKKKG